MHDHNLDLIAALADGSVRPDQADSARNLVATCSECGAEFDAQTAILGILQDSRPASMTEFERARMHRAVHAELPDQVPASTGASRSGWLRWIPAAAAAVVAIALVGALGIGGLLSGGDGAETATAGADVAQEATTEAAREGLADDGGTSDNSLAMAAAPAAESQSDPTVIDLGTIDTATLGQIVDTIVDIGPAAADEIAGSGLYFGPLAFDTDLTCRDIASRRLEAVPTFIGRGSLDGQVIEVFGFGNDFLVMAGPGCEELQTSLR